MNKTNKEKLAKLIMFFMKMFEASLITQTVTGRQTDGDIEKQTCTVTDRQLSERQTERQAAG